MRADGWVSGAYAMNNPPNISMGNSRHDAQMAPFMLVTCWWQAVCGGGGPETAAMAGVAAVSATTTATSTISITHLDRHHQHHQHPTAETTHDQHKQRSG